MRMRRAANKRYKLRKVFESYFALAQQGKCQGQHERVPISVMAGRKPQWPHRRLFAESVEGYSSVHRQNAFVITESRGRLCQTDQAIDSERITNIITHLS